MVVRHCWSPDQQLTYVQRNNYIRILSAKMKYSCLFLLTCITACQNVKKPEADKVDSTAITSTSLIVLGTVQDAGSPHIACKKPCCNELFTHPDIQRQVVSLGIIDPQNKKSYLFEASPDIARQMKLLHRNTTFGDRETPDGIFLTHAHIGHYAGLMYLGREAMDADSVKVYVMPRMRLFLEQNGPWSQLVNTGNINLQTLNTQQVLQLTSNIKVTPFTVPHRDEYSETVGYIIEGPHKKILFIPDIDKWEKWDTDIIKAIGDVDYAFIDATFYDAAEINNRDISEIPHPFVIETMKKLDHLAPAEKDKVYFIHLNHTNPLLNIDSKQTKNILEKGFHIARLNMVMEL